jgi:hypothetical protein
VEPDLACERLQPVISSPQQTAVHAYASSTAPRLQRTEFQPLAE